jgi:hypothetical protein
MARSRSTSKKPSAANSSSRKPPEPLIFFIDRSLGRKKVPEALRAAGVARLRFFCITSSSLTGDQAATLVLSALGAIARLCRQHSSRGFIAKISRGPDVKIIEKGRR